MDFDYDIFISYGHLDNQSYEGEGQGWIDLLFERLSVRLGQVLGFEPIIWRDAHDLRGSDVLDGAIARGVTGSLLFLPVVTPRYVQSEWCGREAGEFHAAAAAAGGGAPPFDSRVFKVVKTPLPKPLDGREPEQLRKFLGYHFYGEDRQKGRVSEFSPDKGSKDIRYWQKLEELVDDIKNRLLNLMQHSPGARRAGLDAGETAETGGGGDAKRKVVYLAETTSDLSKERELVRDELRQRGHLVLPEQKLPLDSKDALAAAVGADLARSELSVHFVGVKYGSTPEDDGRSVVLIQEELAASRGAADASFRRLIWMPPGLTTDAAPVTDERQSRFVEGLQARVTAGVELLQKTVTVEDLKTRIVETLTPADERPAAAAAEHAPGAPKNVYLIFEDSDWDSVEKIRDHLVSEQIDVIPWFDESEGESLMKNHQKCLKECDAALIYFGSSDEFWVRKNLSDLTKAYGYGRASKWLANAVYLGAPPNKRKEYFKTPQALVIRGVEGFDPSKLQDFVRAVAGGGNGGRP